MSGHRAPQRNQPDRLTASQSSNLMQELSTEECLVLSKILSDRLKGIVSSTRATSGKPLTPEKIPRLPYYPPVECNNERLWFTLYCLSAKRQEQVIHKLIPYQYDTPWLRLTDHVATQEELDRSYQSIDRKWLTLTDRQDPITSTCTSRPDKTRSWVTLIDKPVPSASSGISV